MKKTYSVLGLMSGSSLDGLDLAFCEFHLHGASETGSPNEPEIKWKLHAAETLPFTAMWQSRLTHLPKSSAIDFVKTDTFFSYYMAELVNDFLNKHQLEPDFIASHGHTVFHYPAQRFTTQIGSGAALAARTGYPVINDFRSLDIALGGQGAPVAPIADRMLFPGYDFYLNLGGIANISCNTGGRFIAFDIGPANQVLNALANEMGLNFDSNGKVAEQGKLIQPLFDTINAIPYFGDEYPKSLDNLWVMQKVAPAYLDFDAPLADRLHTACRQLAFQTAQSIRQIMEKENMQKAGYQMFVTGGGAMNTFLVACIQQACQEALDINLVLPERNIIDFKEAILIALMGLLRIENIPNCLASVTGARIDNIGGAIYQGQLKKI